MGFSLGTCLLLLIYVLSIRTLCMYVADIIVVPKSDLSSAHNKLKVTVDMSSSAQAKPEGGDSNLHVSWRLDAGN